VLHHRGILRGERSPTPTQKKEHTPSAATSNRVGSAESFRCRNQRDKVAADVTQE